LVFCVCLLIRAAATVGLALAVRNFDGFLIAACINLAGWRASQSAKAAAVADLVGQRRAPVLAGLLRAGGNLGMTAGVPLAGVTLAVGTPLAYRVALCAAGGVYVAAALLVLRLGRKSSRAAARASKRLAGWPWRDGPYVAATVLSLATSLQLAFIDFALPVWISRDTGAPHWTVAAAGLVNTVAVAVLLVPSSRWADNPRRAALITAGSGLVVAAGCALFGLAAGQRVIVACAGRGHERAWLN
jgi:hypothetical protein